MGVPLIDSGADMKANFLLKGEHVNIYMDGIPAGRMVVNYGKILCTSGVI